MSPTPHQYIQKLQLIHGAQITTLILLNIFAYYFRAGNDTPLSALHWLIVLAVFLAITGTASMMVFRMLLRKAQEQTGLQEKLNKYTVAVIARLALIEMSGLFAGVVVLITGNLQAYVVSLIAIMMLIMHMPRPSVVVEDLMLSAEDRAQVERRG
jgi:hypothetical protein